MSAAMEKSQSCSRPHIGAKRPELRNDEWCQVTRRLLVSKWWEAVLWEVGSDNVSGAQAPSLDPLALPQITNYIVIPVKREQRIIYVFGVFALFLACASNVSADLFSKQSRLSELSPKSHPK